MRPSPLLSAAAAAVLLTAVAGPATAATEPAPGVGQALSAGSLLQLSAAGQVLEALRLQLPTSTTDGATALARVTPLLSGGSAVGAPVEVGAGQSQSLPSRTAGIPGLLEVVSPTGTIQSVIGPDGPLSSLTSGVGDLRLLGLDVLGEGTLDVTSRVTDVGSTGTKHLVLDGLALPSLADLLAALGLDLSALPAETLLELVDVLDLLDRDVVRQLTELITLLDLRTVTDLVAALQGGDELGALLPGLSPTDLAGVLDVLEAGPEELAAVGDLTTTIGGLQEILTGLTPSSTLSTQSTDYRTSSLLGPILAPVTGVVPVPLPDLGTLPGLPTGGSTDLDGDLGSVVDGLLGTDPITGDLTIPVLGPVLDQIADPALLATVTDLIGDLQGVTTVPQLIAVLTDLVTELVDTVTALLDGLLEPLLGGLPAGADLPELLDTSLLSIGAMDVTTLARSGDGEAADVTGTVGDIDVLGTDVLQSLLGSSSADLTGLLSGGGLGELEATVDGVLGSVTDVLGELTGLVVPMPTVEVLSVVEEIVEGPAGTRTSRAGVEVLSLDWALTDLQIPAALSTVTGGVTGGLPLALPGLSRLALPTDQLGALLSQDLSLVLGDLTDSSSFTAAAAAPPAVTPPPAGTPTTGTPTTGTPGTVPVAAPQLPRTGASQALAVLGVALMAAAVVARRRSTLADERTS